MCPISKIAKSANSLHPIVHPILYCTCHSYHKMKSIKQHHQQILFYLNWTPIVCVRLNNRKMFKHFLTVFHALSDLVLQILIQ